MKVDPGTHTARIIAKFVALQANSDDSEYRGRCPFHEERTASLRIQAKGRGAGSWYCYGCGAGGDVIVFLAMIDKVSLADAALDLAALLLDGNAVERAGG